MLFVTKENSKITYNMEHKNVRRTLDPFYHLCQHLLSVLEK